MVQRGFMIILPVIHMVAPGFMVLGRLIERWDNGREPQLFCSGSLVCDKWNVEQFAHACDQS